jgi:hypothetical protein
LRRVRDAAVMLQGLPIIGIAPLLSASRSRSMEGLVATVSAGQSPASSANRPMKFACVERALSAYGHFAAKAGEVGGHVHCRACDRTRKPDFWQAARGSDGWLQCDSKSCDTWWCSGCVMVKTPRSLDGATRRARTLSTATCAWRRPLRRLHWRL